MLKKIFSTLLVTGVLAATIVAPVFAASNGKPSRDPSNPVYGQTETSSNIVKGLFCEETFSKPGMGYFIFDADQCGGALPIGGLSRPVHVEPVLPPAPPPVDIPSTETPV